MSNVVPFPSRAPAPEPEPEEIEQNAVGDAFCISCDHKWTAMVPTGTLAFECPGCHRHTGKFVYEFYPAPPTEIRVCNCGNELFYLTREGHMCANCGTYQRYGKDD